jgi:hypothetical protein
MKLLLFLLFSILVNTCNAQEFKEGDIIFQTSQSKQSPLIAYATMSNKTHCGIIVEKDSKIYVLETLGTIKLTPIQTFIDRGLLEIEELRIINKIKEKLDRQSEKIETYLELSFSNEKYEKALYLYIMLRTELLTMIKELRRILHLNDENNK